MLIVFELEFLECHNFFCLLWNFVKSQAEIVDSKSATDVGVAMVFSTLFKDLLC